VGARTELIPALETGESTQSTTLRAMMYVEIPADDESLVYVPSQPFLKSVLRTTPGKPYRVVMPHQTLFPDTTQPFFFQDDARTYFVVLPQNADPLTVSEIEEANKITGNRLAPAFPEGPGFRRYRFEPFYHPWVCNFIARVNKKGLDELLTLDSQSFDDVGAIFLNGYNPDIMRVQVMEVRQDQTLEAVTREHVDFQASGSYSIYNWELFFHAPLLIATKLTENQRFDEARQWLHFIFDPTTRPGAFSPTTKKKANPTQRFWNVRPFWETEGREIHSIDDLLGAEDLSEQYAQWRQNPFKPFAVARLRHTAFMQSVVMRYLDNLIAWGDQQFARFTMESTNEATLLYILAADILGKRPEKIPPRTRPALQTYFSMQQQAQAAPARPSSDAWQNFSELMVEIEAYIPPAAVPDGSGNNSALGRMWAFCLPSNEKLLTYWALVADRLFKLRHCRDMEGVERKIPLWDPPIDPGLLVRAAAAGVDLASVLDDINAALPNYRFTVMLQKAVDLCNEVKNFGAALLAAIEKKDSEGLSVLRSQHEVGILQAMKTVREKQVEESTALKEAADKFKVTVEERRDHYRDIPFLISAEQTGLALSTTALTQEAGAVVSDVFAAIAAAVPQYNLGTSGFYSSPVVVTEYGGEQVSRAASATSSVQRSAAALLSSMSALSHTVGGFQRRWDDWKLQETLANKELDQIEKQIVAATIREEIAKAELGNHDKQTENAKAVDEYLKGKFTNEQLYGWMQSQLAGLYFQAYKLAYDVAKTAERAFRHELGLRSSNYIQFGYWDSLKKGLLAGEKLGHDLKRMEVAYLDQNKREYEITKHVSLAQLNPLALVLLKESGRCEFSVPETLFDLDYSGHYMRRIKSVSVTIPCVVGPYTNVPCTVTLLRSTIRHSASPAAGYNRDLQNDDSRFTDLFSSIQSVVTTSGQGDTGMFETNLRDERYLPFEGAGAISTWRLELPNNFHQFDYDTISDVILHIRYTAREGGESLKQACVSELSANLNSIKQASNDTGLARLFSLKHEFPSEWSRLTTGVSVERTRSQEFAIEKNRFPFIFSSNDIALTFSKVEFYSLPKAERDGTFPSDLRIFAPKAKAEVTLTDASIAALQGKVFTAKEGSPPNLKKDDDDGTWRFELPEASVAGFRDKVDDLLMVCHYTIS
jgi:hypothetical protein